MRIILKFILNWMRGWIHFVHNNDKLQAAVKHGNEPLDFIKCREYERLLACRRGLCQMELIRSSTYL
jgi:hypothetical protein